MKKIVYAKYSNDRADEYKLLTRIAEEDGRRWVEKLPQHPQAQQHIQRIKDICDRFEAEDIADIKVNNCKLVDGILVFDYIDGETLEKIMIDKYIRGDLEGVYSLFDEYIAKLSRWSNITYSRTKEFVEVFGDVMINEDEAAMELADIDMIFSNIMVCDSEWHLIDYEWTFDFPVPTRYVIYRGIQGLLHVMGNKVDIERLDLFDRVSMTDEEKNIYCCMERNFQKYVNNNHYTSEDMYSNIGKRVIPVWEAVEANNYKASNEELKKTLNDIYRSKKWKLVSRLARLRMGGK